jgi:farnesyl diphosphate synthase
MELKEQFEEYLRTHLPRPVSFHPSFEKAYEQMFDAGGKRFRPMLLLSVVRALNPLMVPNAMAPALALEMIHTYSLIHDDLPSFDDAPLRRGHPTLHVTYDEVTAVLVADALNTDAFGVLMSAPLDAPTKVRLAQMLAQNAGGHGMVIGQAVDCYFENQRLDEEQLIFLHTNKTARLIACALAQGALIAGADEKLISEIYQFGIELGVAFQIQDDIIDETKTAEEAGKPTHNDAAKNSFVTVFGLARAQMKLAAHITELKTKAANFGGKLEAELLKLLNSYFK